MATSCGWCGASTPDGLASCPSCGHDTPEGAKTVASAASAQRTKRLILIVLGVSVLANAALAATLLGGLDDIAEALAEKLGAGNAPAARTETGAPPPAPTAATPSADATREDATSGPDKGGSAAADEGAPPAPTPSPEGEPEPEPTPTPGSEVAATPTPTPTPTPSARPTPTPASTQTPASTLTPEPTPPPAPTSEPAPPLTLHTAFLLPSRPVAGETVTLEAGLKTTDGVSAREIAFVIDGTVVDIVGVPEGHGRVTATWIAGGVGPHRLTVRETHLGETLDHDFRIEWARLGDLVLDAPAKAGEPLGISVHVMLAEGAPVGQIVELYSDGAMVGSTSISTSPGGPRVAHFVMTPTAGTHSVRARLDSTGALTTEVWFFAE